MLGLSWAETIVILLVALMVIGPKDLPPIIRAAKQAIAKLKALQNEMTTVLNDAMKESGLEDVSKTLDGEAASLNEEIRYLIDMNGNKQRVYDISDLQPDIKEKDL